MNDAALKSSNLCRSVTEINSSNRFAKILLKLAFLRPAVGATPTVASDAADDESDEPNQEGETVDRDIFHCVCLCGCVD